MSENTNKYPSISDVLSDVTLFLKLDSGSQFTLADFQDIATGRWSYFRDNWDFVKEQILSDIHASEDSIQKSAALKQYVNFSELIIANRSSSRNPLTSHETMAGFQELFGYITINSLDTTLIEKTLIDKTLNRIANLKRDDFVQMRERVRIVHDKSTDGFGIGDEDYDKLYDRVGGSQLMSFRFANYPLISSLRDLISQITSMIPTSLVSDERPDPFAIIRKSLNNPDVPMDSYDSGFLIPFPAGSTLERLAARYLGNPDKWLEIVVANGLQFPYIDEVGSKTPLTINGIESTVIINISEIDNFHIDDEVFVGSDAIKPMKRLILGIEKDFNNDQLIIRLNGEANLNSLLTTQRAYVFHYKAATVNSSKFIMIPTKGGAGFPINAQVPWFTKNLPQSERDLGVDLALTDTGDIIFDENSNDLKLIYGIANGAQAVGLKMNIKLKELMRNPAFGLEEIVGTVKNSDVTQGLITLIIEKALAGDDRFDGTSGIGFGVVGNAVFVNASVHLAGSNGSIPLTFQLPKGN